MRSDGLAYGNPYPYNRSPISGYGNRLAPENYWPGSEIRHIVKQSAQQASQWDRLDFGQCMDEYRTYLPLTKHSDLLIIVSSGTNNFHGWQRNQVYEFDPRTDLAHIWDQLVPPEAVNPLWYWKNCSITTSNYN